MYDKLESSLNNLIKQNFLRRLFTVIFLAGLFLLGIIHWVVFLNFGNLDFYFGDWQGELTAFSVLKESLTSHIIPYHISQPETYTELYTNRFLASPTICLSPHIFFLPLMSIGKFLLANTLLMYSLGFLGCLLIRARYKLSALPFLILYLVFNFNGYITSRIAIGHRLWDGYFLLPLFCLFLFELLEEKEFSRSIIKLSFILFAIFLHGAWHIAIWCILFMWLVGIFNKQYLRPIVLTTLSSIFLSACRLLPTAITYHRATNQFITGYPTVRDMFDALTVIRDYKFQYLGGIFISELGAWEFDIFIGTVALAIIVYFGIYLRFSKKFDLGNYKYKELDLPILLMSIFSLSSLYIFIAAIPLPFFNSERVSSRFLIIPLLMLLLISCIRLQKISHIFLKTLKVKLLLLAGILQIFFSLIGHSKVWWIARIGQQFDANAVNSSIRIINQQDTFYKFVVKLSALISLVSTIALICLYLWLLFHARKQPLQPRE